MENKTYYPSPLNILKYATYTDYFMECYRSKDWQSIRDSFNYVLFRKPPKKDRIIESRMGTFLCRGNTNDFQHVNYAYERQVKDYIARNLKEFDVFIDIGSCMGEYCVWLAKMGKQCIAFEPVPNNFQAINKNVELNNVKNNIQVFPVGLGSKSEEVYFDIKPVLISASGIVRDYKGPKTNVKIERFDDMLPQFKYKGGQGVFMKLDVEGMEVEVLTGAQNFIKNAKKLTLILEKTFSGENNIKTFLAGLGEFTYHDIDAVNVAAVKINTIK